MARELSGKVLAAEVKARVALRVEALRARGIVPRLTVVLVGEDPASAAYVRGKAKDCAEVGIDSEVLRLPAGVTEEALLAEVHRLGRDAAVHGILVQLPLPGQIDAGRVVAAIPPEKDVDGFTPVNVGRMVIGEDCFLPCTPAGCIEMLKSTGVPLAGSRAVVLGRSNIVGKPLALLLCRENATVTLCHSYTKDLAAVCREADILVAAVGRPGFVTADFIKPGAVVLDVGINRGADGKLCGDVDAASAAGWLSPVPGGVGLMTRAMLLENTVKAAEKLEIGLAMPGAL